MCSPAAVSSRSSTGHLVHLIEEEELRACAGDERRHRPGMARRAQVRRSMVTAALRAGLFVAAICLRAACIDRADALGLPSDQGSQPRVLKSWDEETSRGPGVPAGSSRRLQRSRSESALVMLERKLSEHNIQDAKSRAVPGERVLTFSELFAKLSRPEMLEGVRPAYVQGADNESEKKNQKAQKLVVVLVGLPARGKSYISHRLVNYMNWCGVRCRLFNVGAFRRQKIHESKGSRANFFDADNKDAANQREELAAAVLEQLLEWLKHGKGNMMAIFDATNTTRERRRRVLERAMKEAGVSVLFVESICTDSKVIEANLVEKVRLSPDFKDMDFHTAIKDLKSRIANYEAVYETLSEAEQTVSEKGQTNSLSFIKVINLNSKVIANQVHGSVSRSVLSFLMNLHIEQRPIFLVRAPDADGKLQEPNAQGIEGLQLPPVTPVQGTQQDVVEHNVDDNMRTSLKIDCFGDPVKRRSSQVDMSQGLNSFPSHECLSYPIIQFQEERVAVLDLAGEVNIVVHRKSNISMPCSVHYQTVDASAKAGERYLHNSGVIHFDEMQTRAEIKVFLVSEKKHLPEETFNVVLSGAEADGATLGRKKQCSVTILNDEGGLPERLRVDWSRLRFPDASRLREGLNEGGHCVGRRLGKLLAHQVGEFYAHKHKDNLERLIVTRDICQQKCNELEKEIQTASLRKSVVEEAVELQQRLKETTLSNITSTIRLTGHLYNRHLLEKALDIIESKGGITTSVGEPIMGGSSSKPSEITIRVECIRDKEDMGHIVDSIRDVFIEDRRSREQESGGNSLAMNEEEDEKHGVEVLEAARDVGELGKLLNRISEKQAKLKDLYVDLEQLQAAVIETASMTDEAIAAQSSKLYAVQVFTSTLPLAEQTGNLLFGSDGQHEETSALNMVDIGGCWSLTLAEVYDQMSKENVRQFLVSPYTAKLPGGESLRDVVSRLEPFVVDRIERERSPVVIVSHLSTLQVLYQYFVGTSSNLPFWKLNIPRGSVIQLVPHLFGFEERRFSFGPETLDHLGQDGATVHMDSHWVSNADTADPER